jgi:transcriptional regulator with XRE-family HTH domain
MRMRQPTGGLRDVRVHGLAALRANGVAPPPIGGRDAQLGHIFRNMRAAMRLSREALARRLATTLATVDDFEAGAVASLPHWRETVRIVRSYCEILQLDPEPVLWRIQSQLRVMGGQGDSLTEGGPGTGPPGLPPVLLRKDRSRAVEPEERAGRRSVRRLFTISAPLVAVAGALYMAHAAPAPVYRGIALLPPQIAEVVRTAFDNVVLYTAPQRDGLRWVDVGDPQLRKVDKLQTSTR